MAPSYANLFMGKVETELLKEFEKETGLRPTLWLRFLDDVFFVWPYGPDKLKEFIDYMQNFGERQGLKTKLKFLRLVPQFCFWTQW